MQLSLHNSNWQRHWRIGVGGCVYGHVGVGDMQVQTMWMWRDRWMVGGWDGMNWLGVVVDGGD